MRHYLPDSALIYASPVLIRNEGGTDAGRTGTAFWYSPNLADPKVQGERLADSSLDLAAHATIMEKEIDRESGSAGSTGTCRTWANV